MTVQELIDKLNSLPDKNQEIFCTDLWKELSYEIIEVSLDSKDNGPIITIE